MATLQTLHLSHFKLFQSFNPDFFLLRDTMPTWRVRCVSRKASLSSEVWDSGGSESFQFLISTKPLIRPPLDLIADAVLMLSWLCVQGLCQVKTGKSRTQVLTQREVLSSASSSWEKSGFFRLAKIRWGNLKPLFCWCWRAGLCSYSREIYGCLSGGVVEWQNISFIFFKLSDLI